MRGLMRALADIGRLAKPYFMEREQGHLSLGPLGGVFLQERWIGLGLLFLVVAIEFATVWISVRLNFWNRDFYDTLQNKDWNGFLTQIVLFCVLAGGYIAIAIAQIAFESTLKIRWRRWLTDCFLTKWLSGAVHYRLGLMKRQADNPDQRIAQDVQAFVNQTLTIGLRLLSAISKLVSFAVILWGLSTGFTFPGTQLQIPGFLLWAALLYCGLGTWIAHLIGRPLIRLNFDQERFEADFRYALVRVRENGEQVALLRGEDAEAERLDHRFGAIIANFMAIIRRQIKLTTFTAGYGQVSSIWPILVISPYYFAGAITLGQLTQTSGAFGQVSDSLSFFVDTYSVLADYKAVVDRLTTFEAATVEARTLGASSRGLVVGPGQARTLTINALTLALPEGRAILHVDRLVLLPGEHVLFTGPSGSGKSTLFRTIAGIWPFGEGRVDTPQDASPMLLPQRPYLPIGTLGEAVVYPSEKGFYADEAIAEALSAACLPHLATHLHEEGAWGQTLSIGEQQRLAIARALLAKPDWLFLDEATSALDEETEAAVYGVLKDRLPETTLVSIGHRSTLVAFHGKQIKLVLGEAMYELESSVQETAV